MFLSLLRCKTLIQSISQMHVAKIVSSRDKPHFSGVSGMLVWIVRMESTKHPVVLNYFFSCSIFCSHYKLIWSGDTSCTSIASTATVKACCDCVFLGRLPLLRTVWTRRKERRTSWCLISEAARLTWLCWQLTTECLKCCQPTATLILVSSSAHSVGTLQTLLLRFAAITQNNVH